MDADRQPKGRKRITRACDTCHRRGRRCRPPLDKGTAACLTCIEQKLTCTWERSAAKRGAKPRASVDCAARWVLEAGKHGPTDLLEYLIDIYFEEVHPIVYVVNETQFRERWRKFQGVTGRAEYARLMAMCALSYYHVAIGATDKIPDAFDPPQNSVYIEEAIAAASVSHDQVQDLEMQQAIHLICSLAMENGQLSVYHRFMGLQHTVMASQGFSYESRWPADLTPEAINDRRKLFWHIYRLEVHSALTLGHPIRSSELQAAVQYPSSLVPASRDDTCWLAGWNFVTDIYRTMEHFLVLFRSDGSLPYESSPHPLLRETVKQDLLRALDSKLAELPVRFRLAAPYSTDVTSNRCGYQVANIICTYQLLRLLYYASQEHAFHEACSTVLDLVTQMSAVPIEYLRRMSNPMLQELSGFGHVLSSFIHEPLSASDYDHLRTVMLAMSRLLDTLTASMELDEQPGEKLRLYVDKIDQIIRTSQDLQVTQGVNGTPIVGTPLEAYPHAHGPITVPLAQLEQIPWPEGVTGELDYCWDFLYTSS